jgi:flagellar capping protein FliD
MMNDQARQIENDPLTADESELAQDTTESYGTGVHSHSKFNTDGQSLTEQLNEYHEVSPELSGDDLDAAWSQAEVAGEEAVGGTAPTPDQDLVDRLGAAVGLEMDDKAPLGTEKTLELRDAKRWELEPKSSEDYQERREE